MRNYNIETILVGTYYRPTSYNRRHLLGVIDFAEKRDEIWVGENASAYSVRWSDSSSGERYWSTVAVSHE